MPPWWAHAVLYQIYLRSFQDSDGDGIGDLDGARSRLDALVELGVDAVWLSPVHPSPNADFGYDVADYDEVAPEYGGMEALDRFLDAAHERGLKVLLDGVFNHTSTAHRWFRSARQGPDSPHHGFYHWHKGDRPPNNWASTFGGPAWSFDEACQYWYLHSFAPEQPDLNWGNPAVESAVLGSMQRWLDRGVDGFRLDVFNCYAKHAALADNPWRTDLLGRLARPIYPFIAQDHVHDRDRPELAGILRGMRALADRCEHEVVLIGETLDERFVYDNAAGWCGSQALHQAFHFRWLHSRWDAAAFHEAIRAQHAAFQGTAPPVWVLGNHDFKRLASRWGAWTDARTDARMRLVPLLQLGLPGSAVIYQGDELGMREQRLPRRLIADPPGQRFWPIYPGRDGCRTPMAWTDAQHAGFSTSDPWLPLHRDHATRNVRSQRADPGSIWSAWHQMLALRRQLPALRTGRLLLPQASHPHLLTYLRSGENSAARVIANMSNQVRSWRPPRGETLQQLHLGVGSVKLRAGGVELGPLAGAVVAVDSAETGA